MKPASPQLVKKLFVGITGGIGAGKSAFGRELTKLGYTVLSADEIAREITAPGAPALAVIVREFGADSLLPNGNLNRAAMRAKITNDPSVRSRLEAITHPRIQARSQELAKEKFATGAGLVFYEAPLLFEAKSDAHLDAVICVAAADPVRIARVMARDGGTQAEAEALLAAQMPQAEKVARADIVVWNDGDEAALAPEARRVADFLERRR